MLNLMLFILSLCVCFAPPLGVFEYLHNHMQKKKLPVISLPMAMIRRELFFLYMCSTCLDSIDFWCLLGGSSDL